ncbi:MAG: outer membrane beta-barrel protein [Pseudooceanicola atlanticus]
MTRIKTVLLGTALTVTAGAAMAGTPVAAPEDPVIATPVTPVMTSGDWTGGYFGGSLGYGDYESGAASGDGMTGGLFAGYDYDFGSYTLGGEAQYVGNDISVGGTSLDNMARLKARVGYDAGPALIYGTAGVGYADSAIGDDTGYVAGVGMDYKLSNNVSVGAEYLYNHYDDFAGSGSDLTGNTFEARVSYRF